MLIFVYENTQNTLAFMGTWESFLHPSKDFWSSVAAPLTRFVSRNTFQQPFSFVFRSISRKMALFLNCLKLGVHYIFLMITLNIVCSIERAWSHLFNTESFLHPISSCFLKSAWSKNYSCPNLGKIQLSSRGTLHVFYDFFKTTVPNCTGTVGFC